MHRLLPLLFVLFVALSIPAWPGLAGASPYPWLKSYDAGASIARRIAPPPGFERVKTAPGSFGAWLRELPLKPDRPPVLLHNGQRKGNQSAHFAVLDVDVGARDLQQCADAVMRLRAEYLYSRKDHDALHFKFTSGDDAPFNRFKQGYRVSIKGNRVTWVKSGKAGASYDIFRAWLNTVFTYAGTASLSRELKAKPLERLEIGDVFIQGGFPGHAVLVMDMAVEASSGERVFLLAQSYMPAQDIHILRNPGDSRLNPWYAASIGEQLETPEWTFRKGDLKGF